MLTMLPPPPCRRAGTTALQQFQMPLTFTAIAASQSVERDARHLHRRRGARDVELGADRGALFAPHQVERLRAVVDVREHDTRAEAAEIAGVFLPDPARGARDHNDLSIDLHGDITALA